MNDAQLEQALVALRDVVDEGYANDAVRDSIPRTLRAEVDAIVASFGTAAGRAELAADLRELATEIPRGLPPRGEFVGSSVVGDFRDLSVLIPSNPTVAPVRDGIPPYSGPTSVDLSARPPSGPCGAPDGVGDVPLPAAARSGELLTPESNVFTRTTSDSVVGTGSIVPTGQEPVPGEGPGIELRRSMLVGPQQMRVRIHLDDPKGFGPSALTTRITLRPIGTTASAETRPAIAAAKIHCYRDDTDASRGYWEGWVTIPRVSPGFQLIAEVVENDWWFSQPVGLFPRDVLLAARGSQYFAGADRATVHVGDAAVTSAQAIERSLGVFATGGPDGTSGPNVLTDTNGVMGDDLEAPVNRYVRTLVNGKISQAFGGNVVDALWGAVQVAARPSTTPAVSVDTQLVDPSPLDGELTPGTTQALRVRVGVQTQASLNLQILGLPCVGLDVDITNGTTVTAWPESAGLSDQLAIGYRRETSTVVFPRMDWSELNPVCFIAAVIGPVIAMKVINDKVRDGVDGALGATFRSECLFDRQIFNANGTLVHPDEPIAARCFSAGVLPSMLERFDLNDYLPTLSLDPSSFLDELVPGLGTGSASIRPVITNLDNAWCRGIGAPTGCTPDQNLIGRGGLEVTADAALIAGLSDAFGAPLGGRFRNVYAPPVQGSMENVVQTHRDVDNQLAGLGIVLDPRQVNLILRHLSQGRSQDRTTAGILDLTGLSLGSGDVTIRPEVAPIMLGLAPDQPILVDPTNAPSVSIQSQRLAKVAIPDLRVDISTSRGTPPIEFSIGGFVNAGVRFDARENTLVPVIADPTLEIQVLDGCQANYTSGYALSYALCGRGTGGTGGPTTLTDLISAIGNRLLLPLLTKSIGSIGLPSLTGIVPGLNVEPTNVRSSVRGGRLGVYADLKAAPVLQLAISNGPLAAGPTLQFAPSADSSGIDFTRPTTYTWQITDVVTGNTVTTTQVADTDGAFVFAPVSSFATTTESLLQVKIVRARLTVAQAGLSVSAEGTHRWYPPSLPPSTPCPIGAAALRPAALVIGGVDIPC